MPPTTRLLPLPGLPLALHDHGGDGPPVLLLHGFLDTGRSFDAVAAAAPHLRVLALDFRGHGASPRAPLCASYHQLDHLKDLIRTLDRLEEEGLAPEILAGHSMGGIVALLLAGCWPERVRRLLLIESLGARPATPSEQVGRLGRALRAFAGGPVPFRSFATPAAAAARVRENNPRLSAEGARRFTEPILRRRADGRWEFPFDPRLRGPSPFRHSEEFWLEVCRRVTAPVEVLAGEHGLLPAFPAAAGRLAALPRARLRTVPGAGHALHLDHPDEIAAALGRLLTSPATTA